MRISDWSSDVCSSDLVLGEHHFSLAVFGENQKRLAENLSTARPALADAGLVAAREGPALEAAFWLQLPGNFAWRARPAAITSRNFSVLSPSHTFRSDEHTSELQSLMRNSYAVFCVKK